MAKMNPYELRLEMVKTAQNRLTNRYEAQVERYKALDLHADQYPNYPTEKELIDIATQIKYFVSDDGRWRDY